MKVSSVDFLFPLERVLPGAASYFMDAHGEVWSTRVHSMPVRLLGSKQNGVRYVSLQLDATQKGPGGARVAAYGYVKNLNKLQLMAMAHPSFVDETKSAPASLSRVDLATAMGMKIPAVHTAVPKIEHVSQTPWPFSSASPTPKAAVVQAPAVVPEAKKVEPKKATYWYIGTMGQFGPTQIRPDRYLSEGDVNVALEKLAKTSPGTTFAKFELHGTVTANGLVWQ